MVEPPFPVESTPTLRGRPSAIIESVAASDDAESDTSVPVRDKTNTTGSSQDFPLTIPPALLTRLVYYHFKHSKMRIGKDAYGVVGKYRKTFVRSNRNNGVGMGRSIDLRVWLGDSMEIRGRETQGQHICARH